MHASKAVSIAACAATLAVAGLLAGCASQSEEAGASLAAAPIAQPAQPADAASIQPTAGGYTLSAAETKLDCAKLTGQMKVRIANMRAAVTRPPSTDLSRTMQATVTPVFGGPKRGADPAADLQLDRAKLEAFNKRLVEKKCKPLDIDAELRGETPAPAPAKAAKGKN